MFSILSVEVKYLANYYFIGETITESLVNGTILQGLVAYYVNVAGPFFYVLFAAILFIPLVVRPQFAEFTAIAYILTGYVLQDYFSGTTLRVGQILMIVGLAGFFLKVLLGSEAR